MDRLEIGDIIEGRVSDFASGGEGVLKQGAYPVFVPFAIKGELVRARITYAKKDCAFGELVEVKEESPDRIKPYCTYFGKCGGCDLQHMSTSLQLEIKQNAVKNAFRKIAGMDVDVPLPVRVNDWEYRNKLSLPFVKNGRSNRISVGFFEKRSHKVVPLKWCPLHGEWAAKLIECVTSWANEFSLSVYDEKSRKGLLRHVVARMLDTLSVTIVVNGDRLPRAQELAMKLQEKFQDFSLFVSPNKSGGNVILGENTFLVCGREKAQGVGGFSAVVSPKSFLQVNGACAEKVYDEVARALGDENGDVVELYSGVGLLTAQLALRLKNSRITAVEIEPSASKDATRLMASLGLDGRVKCVCDDAAHFVCNRSLPEKFDVDEDTRKSPLYLGDMLAERLVIDPPRKGCDESVLACAKAFERIVYVSCNPQTLARDAKILSESHSLCSIKTFDMFPQTANVETVAAFEIKR